MADGAFDALTGMGEPLSLDENPFEDPSLRMAHRLLKNNGFAPAWIEEGKDIDVEAARLRADLRRADGLDDTERCLRRARELNVRITGFNLKAPAACQKLPVDIRCEIARREPQ